MSESPTLLVLRPLGLGDFLTGVPAYRALARAFPGHRRVLAAPGALRPLVPYARAFHELLDAAPLAPLRGAPPRPDVAVNLHGRGPQSHRVLLQLQPSRLLAFAHAEVTASSDGASWRADEHEVQRWCRMLEAYSIAADPSDLDLRLPDRSRFGGGYVLIHPGAASAARRWPAERWASVARFQREVAQRVVLVSGRSEGPLALEIARRAALPAEDVHAGDLDLLGLAMLVQGALLVVCGDTGIAHLATALRRPSVLLFGPTAPALWGPPAERTWHRVIWHGREGDAYGDRVDPGLLEITVEEVLAEIAALSSVVLSTDARPPRASEPRWQAQP